MIRLKPEKGLAQTVTSNNLRSSFKWDNTYLDTINYIAKSNPSERIGPGYSGAPVFMKYSFKNGNKGKSKLVFGGSITGGNADDERTIIYIVKPSIIKKMVANIISIN